MMILLEPFYSWSESYDKSAEFGDAIYKTVDNQLAQTHFDEEQLTQVTWKWKEGCL